MSLEDINDTPEPASPIVEIQGEKCMKNGKGNWVPVDLIKPQQILQDDTVRKLFVHAEALNAQIARFRGNCFEDMGAFEALLAEKYGGTVGGNKGNITLLSLDGCMRIRVTVADLIDFGPELQVAKSLIDECLNEWSANGDPKIRALITRAFNTEKQGQINRSDVFMLLQLDIDDERWKSAMDAIRDAIRVVGSKTYINFHTRSDPRGKWQHLPIDMAKV